MNLKMLGTSSFFLLTSTVQPVIFATIAFYMFESGGQPGTLLYAALGAGMMGVWSTTLFGSGGMIQWQRWQGTLELGVGAPPSMALVYLPFSLANAFTGCYALAATLLWGRLVFGVPLHFVHPIQFVVALAATVLSLGLMGLVLASTFILYRHANALSNLLEYPVWIASGLVFSTSLLPEWTRPISWCLPPYWGIIALRHAALGGDVWGPLAMTRAAGARRGRDRNLHLPLVRAPCPRPRDPLADMKRWFSTFFVGGVIAYRGLFNWIRPAMYIPTMLGSPLFQLIFFTKLGQYAHAEDADFYIVGNAVQVCAMSSVYGMTMAVANERWFGTLGPLLASPANRAAVFLGRGVPVLANGLLVSAFTFGAGVVLLGFRPPLHSIPALVVVVLVTVTSCTAFGMLLGSIGLRAKDFFFAANLAYFLMLLFCGVNIPIDQLPGMDGRRLALPAADPRHRGRANGRRGRLARRRRAASS